MKVFLAALLFATPAFAAGTIVTDVPQTPDTAQMYVIYLHGRIIEDSGPRPTHPRFGLYDYPAVLEALASRGATVIAQERRRNTNMDEYAGIVVAQVERLIRAGVPESHIAVVGFSKGGGIAVRVSSFLRRDGVRFALLAACPKHPQPHYRLTGHVLSVRETSDDITGSCKPLVEHAEKPQEFKEIMISTGRKHGAFYRPLPEWVGPVLDWVDPKKAR